MNGSYRFSISARLILVIGVLLCTVPVFAGEPHAALAHASTAKAPTLPRVVSINLCADQLLLALADDRQIAALTNLSHQKAASWFYREARRYPFTRGKAGEVIVLKPDLVLAGQYSSRYTLSALKSAGLRVEKLPIANSVEAMLKNIEQTAQWLGQPDRGAEMVTALNKRLAAIKAPLAAPLRAAVYDPNGYTVGDQSLRGDVLRRSGWHNVANDAGISSFGVLSLETLLRLQPDVLVESAYSAGTYSRAQQLNQHPALTQSKLAPEIISVPSSQTICGGPWTVDLIEHLSAERIKLQRGKS
ncbi:hypothetical protein AB833_03620 [Chromatiales bacterium (ex Bugula neritina AB1)]|nr:hypothetical protein AB833_03620 [Chromatiales bacterium (ex Bugula neritina AB1)]